MKPNTQTGTSFAVLGILLLTLSGLASCRTEATPAPTGAAVPQVIADPSAQAIVVRLLTMQRGSGLAFATRARASIQTVSESALVQKLQTGEAQLAFGLGSPPEGLWAAQLGWEGILVTVQDGNPVRAMTLRQLGDVFSGKVTNWSDLGGSAGVIHLVGLEKGAPVRLAFDQSVLGREALSSEAEIAPASWAVVQLVRADPLAIGYLPCIDLASGLSPLEIEGVAPRGAPIQRGEYALRIPVMALARQPPGEPWASFVAWAQGGAGQLAFRELCQP